MKDLNPYMLPTNTDLEKVLKQNLDHVKPLEIKSFHNGQENKLFPFWKPVGNATGEVFYDYKAYLDKKSKALDIKEKRDKVGIVQPKDASKTYEDNTLMGKINSVIDKQNSGKLSDETGVVEPKTENMPKGTTKQVTDNRVGEVKEAKVEKAATSKTGVGAVKAKSEGMPKGTKSQVVDNQVGDVKEAKVVKSAKSTTGVGAVKIKNAMPAQTKVDVTAGSKKATGENVGVVKPKVEKITTVTNKQVTDNKVDKPVKPTVEKAAKNEPGKVGIVKAKADLGKQNNVGAINFDKYKTDHISKAAFESSEKSKSEKQKKDEMFGVAVDKKGIKNKDLSEPKKEVKEGLVTFESVPCKPETKAILEAMFAPSDE